VRPGDDSRAGADAKFLALGAQCDGPLIYAAEMSEAPRGRLLRPGAEIDGFVIEAIAGRGGMGVVYRARQKRPDRVVALKVIAPDAADDDAFRTRFMLESSIAAQIEHPNVIPVYAVGEADGILYIAMRYVDGTDMRSLLSSKGRLDPARAAAIVDGAGRALDAAHANGLVHRDVKPANIMLATVAGHDHVYLTDFGLSRHMQSTSGPTRTGAFLGTIDYVAPEQARGERVDARADVYSLGCVLFTALTGSVPFDLDSDMAKLYAHDRSPAPSVLERAPDLPPAFEDVLARAMAKRPGDRYRSAGDLGRAALAAAAGAKLPSQEHAVAAGAAAAVSEPPATAPPSEPTAVLSEPTAVLSDPTVSGAAPATPRTTVPIDPGATELDPGATELDPGATGLDPGATELDPSATVVDPNATPGGTRSRPEPAAGAAADPPPKPKSATPPAGRRRLVVIGALVAAAAVAGAIALSGGGGGGGGGDKGAGGSASSTDTTTNAADTGSDQATADIPSNNLTSNPSFEDNTAGWDRFNSELSSVDEPNAPDGTHVARVALTGSETEYAIDDSPDSVKSSTKGTTYSAVAWAKGGESTAGKPVCMSIRERSEDGSTTSGVSASQVVTDADSYQPVRASYVAKTDGSRIDVHVFRQGSDVQPGEDFFVDAITLTASEGEAPTPECEL
jgi:serine/threonine protein kinase